MNLTDRTIVLSQRKIVWLNTSLTTNVGPTCSDDWAPFWEASTSIRGRIFVSAGIRADSRFKLFLCFVSIEERYFRMLSKMSSCTLGYAYPRLITIPLEKTSHIHLTIVSFSSHLKTETDRAIETFPRFYKTAWWRKCRNPSEPFTVCPSFQQEAHKV